MGLTGGKCCSGSVTNADENIAALIYLSTKTGSFETDEDPAARGSEIMD
jgi:hypothetical protein